MTNLKTRRCRVDSGRGRECAQRCVFHHGALLPVTETGDSLHRLVGLGIGNDATCRQAKGDHEFATYRSIDNMRSNNSHTLRQTLSVVVCNVLF